MSQEVVASPVEQPISLSKRKNRPQIDYGAIESILIQGDISRMSEVQRIDYMREVCKVVGLNPLTRPFDYIAFQGSKICLYANKGAAEQLRDLHGVSIRTTDKILEGMYIVRAEAVNDEGRQDSSIGVVSIGGLKGDALANAMMKAETKAKRRVTLSICGLNMLDETEVDTVPGAIKGEKVFKKVPGPRVSKAQLVELFQAAKDSGQIHTKEALKELAKEHFPETGGVLHELTGTQFEELMTTIENMGPLDDWEQELMDIDEGPF